MLYACVEIEMTHEPRAKEACQVGHKFSAEYDNAAARALEKNKIPSTNAIKIVKKET